MLYYFILFQIRLFRQFHMWKSFCIWRKSCVWKKINNAKKELQKSLFVLNPVFQPALLEIQTLCYKLLNVSFADIGNIEENPLFMFIEVQVC